MSALPEPAALAQRLLDALDRARESLGSLSVLASRVAAFQVLSGAERASDRLPWLRARVAALLQRERSGHRPAILPEGWADAWSGIGAAADALTEAAAGADHAVDGADEPAMAGPALRLQRLAEALDVVEERLARLETTAGAP
jgi:hypothetical protein